MSISLDYDMYVCTPNCMIYGELGCYPVSVTIQMRIISYWLKLTSSSGNRICRKLYDLLFTMHMEGSFQSEWLTILERNDFGNIWVQQGINCDMEATRDDLKTRINLDRSGRVRWRPVVNAYCIETLKGTYGFHWHPTRTLS